MGKRRLTPQEKKKNKYDKDYVLNVEYPHSFRTSWKEGMREENRHYRRKVKQQFRDLDNCEDAVKSIRLRKCSKKLSSEIWSVRERVQTQLNKRRIRQAWNYFKLPYNSEYHRQNFANFLESLMQGRSLESQEMAKLINGWLYPLNRKGLSYEYVEDLYQRQHGILIHPDPSNNYWYYQWLQEFFKDEPEWELRLKNWVDLMLNLK